VKQYGGDEKPSSYYDENIGKTVERVVDPAATSAYVAEKHGIMKRVLNELKSPHADRLFAVPLSSAEEAIMPKNDKEESKVSKSAPEKEKKTTDVEITGGATLRKGSVLHAIYRSWDLKEGATKEEILDRLVKEFPDRSRESMTYTVNTQTAEMPKNKGFELGRDDDGRYGLHIKGRSTKRIVSPERAAKIAEKAKAKEAKAEERAKAAKAKAKSSKEGVVKHKVDGSGKIVKAPVDLGEEDAA
jgi:hypothetical protein